VGIVGLFGLQRPGISGWNKHGGELVTELVSRHSVVTCYRVLSDLRLSCNPRFWPQNAM